MAAPLDWDAFGGIDSVRQLCVSVGPREAARRLGMSNANAGALRQRCAREGWMDAVRSPKVNPLVKPVDVTAVTKTGAEAHESFLRDHSERSKAALAASVTKGAEEASKLDGMMVLGLSQSLHNLAKTAQVVHGWQAAGQSGPNILIQFLGGTGED